MVWDFESCISVFTTVARYKCNTYIILQVGELKATFSGLQLDVEAMFMQMPSVDLDELGSQLEAMQQHQQEQVGLPLTGMQWW